MCSQLPLKVVLLSVPAGGTSLQPHWAAKSPQKLALLRTSEQQCIYDVVSEFARTIFRSSDTRSPFGAASIKRELTLYEQTAIRSRLQLRRDFVGTGRLAASESGAG